MAKNRTNTFVFDTTYVLPLFGIEIKLHDSFTDEIKDLWSKRIDKIKLILPTTCLLESLYKLNREYRIQNDFEILKRYSLVLPSITKHSFFTVWDPLQDHGASSYALRLRNIGHQDILD